ncbi:MAG: hypothetical protein IKQ71_04515 [Lachnospiraceae bacterium]|nr:hypothetical protein [Lachnospiraceae bacterium]
MTKKTTIKKLLTVIMTLIMAICLMPVVGVKADGDVASVYNPYSNETTNYTTLQDAFTNVPESGTITLLSNVIVAEGETVTLRDNVGDFNLDLNGHSFTVNGTLTSKDQPKDMPTYPGMHVNSKISGTFNSTGIINISIQPWTGDTYNFKGGINKKFFGCDGGTVNISSGEFVEGVFFNNGGQGAIDATISGNAKIKGIHSETFVIYPPRAPYEEDPGTGAPLEWSGIHLTLKGGYYDTDPRILYRESSFDNDELTISNNYNYRWTNEVVTGYKYYLKNITDGTFTEIQDPSTITQKQLEDELIYICYKDFVTVDESAIEEYNGQTDWDADPTIYKFRIKDTSCAHSNTEVKNKVDATCTLKGYSGDTVCKDCGVVIKEGSAIDPLGHEYSEPTYTWSGDGKTCTATLACTRMDCPNKITEEGTITSAVTTQPTSDKKGITTYTATFKDSHFKAQTKAVEDIPVATAQVATVTPVADTAVAETPVQTPTKVTTEKKKNTAKIKFYSNKTFKVKQLKAKGKSFTCVKTTKPQGKVKYTIKPNKQKKYFSLSNAGKLTVKKGLPKGVYKIIITVKVAGNKDYKNLTKTHTLKVTVK